MPPPNQNVSYLNKASYVSIGLMVLLISVTSWISASLAKIETQIGSLPLMQVDISAMKDILAKSNGTMSVHSSRIQKLESRMDKAESLIRAVELRVR